MEEEDTKQCPNCKREIPSVNFTTHSVHCARNLRNCPVCKEPVPVAQLQEHHDALHKEVPCKKCGESVCGTDLEDHIRDSCAQTIKPCRYCELELPRHALPPHETYCGARSEQCPECKEYVMIKYRQLHLDSNHGFIRLSDDPVPIEIKAKPKPITNGFVASTSRQTEPRARPQTETSQTGPTRPDLTRHTETPQTGPTRSELTRHQTETSQTGPTRPDLTRHKTETSQTGPIRSDLKTRPQTEMRYFPGSSQDNRGVNGVNGGRNMEHRASDSSRNERVSNVRASGERNGKARVKRTNDQPQINTSVEPREKVHKELPSRGAVKKRPAPQPPASPADPKRDLPYWSAQKRAQDEERKRQEETAYNLSVGLPPVLSPAAKLDKLRKMDALHNRELEEDYCHKLRGRVWQPTEPGGHRLGEPDRVGQDGQIDDLSHLRPMTAQQFMDRFQELQLGGERPLATNGATSPGRSGTSPGRSAASGDRFSEIKSSLRELRRGLNEVTAPYNSASNATNNTNIDSNRLCPPDADAAELRLPCEFCGVPILADNLVLHQTGCRPDLTQYRPKKSSRSRSPRPRPPRPRTASEMDDPVIPCEFCTESLPVYLISEHQVRRLHCRSY
ncbi:uncharacterized protein LOC134657092 [Cydia amplana]|uniref:uncharacterized protein LOC134657092 n=1 Tax=Cydia amplana TaxID=1869771 RepID=UPI002FE57E97